ncbi:unnamed protein product [Rhizoctonia solani]|uniref:Lysine-specific metallo-endopeptidase domain-containing protein n=1 Tax=Rhizoctonia solani TaxID=456999 RepID=A0A8H3GGL4_9AGAM|nr:unnamed protein product [Rhizoctonia solani]
MRIHTTSFLTIIYGVGVFSANASILSVSFNVPGHAASIDQLVVKAMVTNTGSETLKLMNDPRTVLSTAQTKTFIITKSDNVPEFTGMIAKYSPQRALKNNGPNHFTVLAPGESLQPSARKTHQRRSRPTKRQGISQIGCSDAQLGAVLGAAKVAEQYLAEVNTYMSSGVASPRYTSWFGSWDIQRATIVANHFANMIGDAPLATYNCAPADCTPDVFAYVFANEPLNINLCGAFWESPLIGTDSQGGTIIHELSHFTVNGGTEDYRYGPEKCLVLAQSDPLTAIMNADSHQYFAENNPAQQ